MNPVRFSIFLPVRNGFPYIKDCIQSILNQSYPHFELNILDNLSTDETVSWIASLKDPRIHLFTSSKPLSMEDSWARILDIPKQKYITLIGHDDLFEPHFLEVIENLITKYPNASLYQTGALFINPKGKKYVIV